jgi:hypothetical protein
VSILSLSSDVLLSHPNYHRGAACDCRCLTVALVAANMFYVYPVISLENAVLFGAQSLLFLSMPRDLAFGDEYLFEELPCLSA